MNLNEFIINHGRGRGKKTIRGNIYGINKIGSPGSTTSAKKNSISSSELNWGKSHISVPITPSTVEKSAGSSKISSEDSRIVVALTEGRGEARCEVGIAAINVSVPLLILCQISDTQSYINTLTKINIFNPHEILIPTTFIENFSGNRLIDKVKQRFPNIRYTGVARSKFSKIIGREILSKLCIPSLNSILLVLQHRYYALAAAAALITHLQDNLFIYYAGGSIKIDYQESEGYAIIDVSTADRLELVCSTKPEQGNKFSSLFGVLNHCQTKIGARTLRSSILQPPCDVKYIEERQNCVSDLVKHPEALLSIQALLQKVPNIDLLLSIATIIPEDPQRCSNRQLNYILLVNSLLDLVAPLKEVVSKLTQLFYKKLRATLESEDFTVIKDIVRKTIQDGAHPAKGQAGIMQRCFAIKPGINGLLDLVRKTYSERVDDMRARRKVALFRMRLPMPMPYEAVEFGKDTFEYVKNLGEKHGLALTLANNQSKGHHIVLSLNQQQKRYMKKSDLPEEFIYVNRLVGSFTMKTPELINLSTRLDDIMIDILSISNVMVHSTIVEIKKYVGLFYKLCEEVAHLDILQSLAEASIRNGYVRPKFGQFTEVTFAHHPLLDFLLPKKPISNNISCSDDFNVHIITGPNGSGKSIFIRQVVLLQVMAQVGCFVPAQSAVFRPADRIYARIYFEDNMEYGASSFMLEMKEIKYIMTTMTENSLIIIDELCRSTSLEEGTALAIAIIEKLAQSSAFVYITTHYTMLTKLYDMYLNVIVWQLETIPSGEDPKTFNLDFKYNLISGITSVKHYGVYIVRNIWPDSILQNVYELLNKITKKYENPKFTPLDEKVRLKYAVEAEFRKLKSQKKLTIAEINKILNQYQNNLQRLGCSINSINVAPMDNPYSFQESLPQIRHSVFDNTQTAESFNDSNENVRSMDERMRSVFTPDSSIFFEHGADVETQRPEEEIKEIFTPDSVHQNQQPLSINSYFARCGNNKEALYNGSNYKNIYEESASSLSQSSSNIVQNVFGLFGTDFLKPTNDTDNRNNPTTFQNFFQPQQVDQQHSSSVDLSQDMNEFRFSEPLCNEAFKTSTPVPHQEYLSKMSSPSVHIYSQKRNFSTPSSANHLPITKIVDSAQSKTLKEIDLESIREDLEICSKTFDDNDFEESILNTSNKPPQDSQRSDAEEKEVVSKKKLFPHIIPNVIINEGPNNTTLSFDGNNSISGAEENVKDENRIKVISNIMLTSARDDYPVHEQRTKNNYKEVEKSPLDREECKSSDTKENDDKAYEDKGPTDTNSEDNDVSQNENNENVSYKAVLEEQEANNITSQGVNISEDEESKPDENLDSSNKVDKTVMTSISNASKLRNLDQATSESSPQEDSSAKKTSTSISTVSRKRNLDQITTESSPSNELDKSSAEKAIDNSETTSSMKESDNSGRRIKSQDAGQENKRRKLRKGLVHRNKFVPPRKLSAKEIREEFKEQDRKLLESSPGSSNFSKYLKQFVKRPSVKQVQNTTHLAFITRTDEGFEVIPAPPTKKGKKKSPIKRHFSNETFNMSIFSDKNAQPFENYLNSNEKDYKTFSFNFLKNREGSSHEDKFEFQPTGKSFGEYTSNSVTTRFVRKNSDTCVSQPEANFGQNNVKTMTMRQPSEMSEAVGCGLTQQNVPTMTPDGFYKQNKEDMTRIVNKYLLSGTQEPGPDTNRNLSKLRSIFENEDINVSDLDI